MQYMKKIVTFILISLCIATCSRDDNTIPECTMLPYFSDTSKRSEGRTLKGELLFSWREGSFWHYSIVPNLNISPADENISVTNSMTGEECLKQNLSLFAVGEEIYWFPFGQLTTVEGKKIYVKYPPESVVNEIVDYCEELEIELTIEE